MLKKARYWKKINSTVRCELCPHNCMLHEGQLSSCKTRINADGTLYTKAYGNPIALHIDPVEKKPLYHFLPSHKTYSIAVAGCNLHCKGCQNANISQTTPESNTRILSPQQVIDEAIKHKCKSISLTYTEPTAFYEYALDIAKVAHKNEIPVILVSAGYINPAPLKELIPYIAAANIDLKSMTNSVYKEQTTATLKPILSNIKSFHQSSAWLEITNLLIPEINTSNEDLHKLCEWLVENKMQSVPLHFSRFFPHHKLMHLPATEISTLNRAFAIAKKAGIRYVYLGNINSGDKSNTNCPKCGYRAITRINYRTSISANFKGTCPVCKLEIDGIW